MEKKTKQRILDEAFDLFSDNGFAGTSIQDISDRLGLTKPAIYRHYQSKEDILNAIIERIDVYYNERMNADTGKNIPNSIEDLIALAYKQVEINLTDNTIIRIRKLLTIEQFNNPIISRLATEHFITDIRQTYKKHFETLIENKIIKDGDAEIYAFAFFSPISCLIQECYRHPEKTDEIKLEIKKYTKSFFEAVKA